MAIYFGYAIAAAMLPPSIIAKSETSAEEVAAGLSSGEWVSCANPSHTSTTDALKKRFNLDVPTAHVNISLNKGDTFVCVEHNLGRLPPDRKEFTEEEVASATIKFFKYEIM